MIVIMTGKQHERWNWLKAQIQSGNNPTIREMMEAWGLRSPAPVQAFLDRMIDAGLLSREPGKARALRIVGDRTPAQWREYALELEKRVQQLGQQLLTV